MGEIQRGGERKSASLGLPFLGALLLLYFRVTDRNKKQGLSSGPQLMRSNLN